jgi:hypothetical protein
MVDLSLTLLGYGGLCVFVLFVFLSSGFWQRDSTQGVQFGEWPATCVVDGMFFGRILSVFPLDFEVRSTHIRLLLLDTRHPAVFLVVFRLYCRKYRPRESPELGEWSSRAKESLLSDCA